MREIKLCQFCKVDTERFGCFCIPEKDPNDHVSKKALREWCEEMMESAYRKHDYDFANGFTNSCKLILDQFCKGGE